MQTVVHIWGLLFDLLGLAPFDGVADAAAVKLLLLMLLLLRLPLAVTRHFSSFRLA